MTDIYRGVRLAAGTCIVNADTDVLDPHLEGYNHSPGGFEWGYPGSGPAQLALAICIDYFRRDHCAGTARAMALLHYQELKEQLIVSIKTDTWEITREQIRAVVMPGDDDRVYPPESDWVVAIDEGGTMHAIQTGDIHPSFLEDGDVLAESIEVPAQLGCGLYAMRLKLWTTSGDGWEEEADWGLAHVSHTILWQPPAISERVD